jgi:hypothetical protein
VSHLEELRALVKAAEQERQLARNYDAITTAERHIASARKKVAAEVEVIVGQIKYGTALGWTDQQLRDWLCLTKAELEELRKAAKAAKAGR